MNTATARAAPPPPDPLAAYLARLHPGGSRRQQTNVAARVAVLLGRDAATLWSALDAEAAAALRDVMVRKRYRPATIRTHLSCLRAVAITAAALGLMEPAVLTQIRAVRIVRRVTGAARSTRVGRPRGRVLSEAELAKVFAACSRYTVVGRRDRAVLALLVTTGLRVSELCALTLGDLAADAARGVPVAREVRIRSGGVRVARRAFVPDRARAAVLDYLEWRARRPDVLGRGPEASADAPLIVAQGGYYAGETTVLGAPLDPLLRQTIGTRLGRLTAAAGLPRVGPNDLRQTFLARARAAAGRERALFRILAGFAVSARALARYDGRVDDAARAIARTLDLPHDNDNGTTTTTSAHGGETA